MPLWNLLIECIPDKGTVYFIGIVLLCLAGFITFLCANLFLNVIRDNTKMIFALFLLLYSTIPDFDPVRPVFVATLFFFLALHELFRSYQDMLYPGKSFNIMFYLCLGSMLWIHLLWLIPLFWIGMHQFRVIHVRNFIASFLGIFTFFVFVWAWCLWRHDFSFFTEAGQRLVHFDFVLTGRPLPGPRIVTLVAVSLSVVAVALNFTVRPSEHSVRIRQFLSYLWISQIYLFVLLFVFGQYFQDFLFLFCIPTAILLANLFADKSRLMRLFYWIAGVFLFLCFLFVRAIIYL